MKIAIVGSRTFPHLHLVAAAVAALPPDTVVVSGGASGVDSCAVREARQRGLPEPIVYLPQIHPGASRVAVIQAMHARNQLIVDSCDEMLAFTEKQDGGTWDAIRRCRKARKPLRIVTGEATLDWMKGS